MIRADTKIASGIASGTEKRSFENLTFEFRCVKIGKKFKKLEEKIMRNINFRVWDIVNKEFTYAPNKQFLIGLNGDLFDGNGNLYDESHIAQQATDLKDFNGKQIFEGDILDYEPGQCEHGKVKFKVVYHKTGLFVEDQDGVFDFHDPNTGKFILSLEIFSRTRNF